MKRLIALLFAAVVALMVVASPSYATEGGNSHNEVDGKDVTLCHYSGSNYHGGSGKYTKITVDINGFLSGHEDHTNDIWAAFSYVERTGADSSKVVNVAAQGDTSRLAFADCKVPDDEEKIAKPEVVFADECGTKNDVFSVAPGRGYTVGSVQHANGKQSITVSLADEFVWSDGSHDNVTFVKNEFTNADCPLPDTGGLVKNTAMGVGGLGLIALIGAGLFFYGRRTREA